MISNNIAYWFGPKGEVLGCVKNHSDVFNDVDQNKPDWRYSRDTDPEPAHKKIEEGWVRVRAYGHMVLIQTNGKLLKPFKEAAGYLFDHHPSLRNHSVNHYGIVDTGNYISDKPVIKSYSNLSECL